jgi:hypothetical protein
MKVAAASVSYVVEVLAAAATQVDICCRCLGFFMRSEQQQRLRRLVQAAAVQFSLWWKWLQQRLRRLVQTAAVQFSFVVEVVAAAAMQVGTDRCCSVFF